MLRRAVCFAMLLGVCFTRLLSSASAQPEWVFELPAPPVPDPAPSAPSTQEQLSLPTLPESGLLEPPPPLPVENAPEGLATIRPPVDLPPDGPVSKGPVSKGPVWYYPWTWIPLDGWENSAELGFNGTDGNAESFSLETGARFKRKTDLHLFDLRFSHFRTTANGVEVQNNAFLYVDYERSLGQSPWTYFVKNGLAYDRFGAFDLRYNINSGLGYSIFKTDDLKLTSRFGAGASREFGGPDDVWVPEALFGLDYEHQVNARNKLIARTDYFPEWADFRNFRLVTDLAWEHLIDETGNFSLKLGAIDRYDSTPNGAKPNDVNYSALFLYKF